MSKAYLEQMAHSCGKEKIVGLSKTKILFYVSTNWQKWQDSFIWIKTANANLQAHTQKQE